MFRRLVCLALVCLMFTACSKLDLSDVVSTGGATAAAATSAAVGLPAAGTAILTAVGGVSAGALVEDGPNTNTVCLQNPELCGQAKLFELLMSSVHWIIGGIVALMIMSWLIPGPQSFFFWRDNNGRTNSTNHRSRPGRRNT